MEYIQIKWCMYLVSQWGLGEKWVNWKNLKDQFYLAQRLAPTLFRLESQSFYCT